MKRKIAFGIMATLLLIGMLTLAFSTQSAKAEPIKIITVPDDHERIQWAVGNATKGDTIFVRAGTYYEHVVVNKALTLIGENRSNTIIDGSGFYYTGALVTMTADNVNMRGFTVTNTELEGIKVENSRYCEVHETVVCFTGDRGIVFFHGGNNKAYNNIVYNSSAYGAIEAIWSSNNTINNNLAYFNQAWGVATNNGSYNLIYNNTVYSNRDAGIHIDLSSTGNNVYNNNISYNNLGIQLLNLASENTISDNEISGNFYGVYLEHSLNNTISGNNITNNGDGIRLDGFSHYNSISGNHISNNDYGIKLELSSNNRFYHNNVTDNTNQVSITSGYANFWDDGYHSGGNYWSDYTGEDADVDGIGDTPYVIDEDNQDNYPLGVFAKKAEPFPTLIVAGIAIIAVVGAVVIVYFMKFKK